MTPMMEPSDAGEERPLPDPREEQETSAWGAMHRADQAAWRTRRLIETSRAWVIGNAALVWAALPAAMLWWEIARPALASQIVFGLAALASVVWTIYCAASLQRMRSLAGVGVVDRMEGQFARDAAAPGGLLLRLLPGLLVSFGMAAGWMYAFHVLPYHGVVVTMWSVAAISAGWFVVRFIQFQFWEDLLFAASVFACWGLYLSRSFDLVPLAVIPLLAIAAGTISLHRRWQAWTRSLAAHPDASLTADAAGGAT
ncbi:MAG TPA: hypothetical protein VGE52_01110 [Pirellulales bacterium]